MISQVRRQYPDCEFVLVPSFYGNIHCHFRSYYDACRDALLELEDTYSGVACADITSMQASLLEFKDYLDFSGDNMCHPNDFMARLYAQVCLETIVPGGVDAYVPAKDPEEKPDPEPVNPSALGDINGDGRITPADITLFRLYVAGNADAGQVVREACDLNGDGRITPADITVLRLYLAGRIILEAGEIVELLPPEYWITEIENKADSIKERQESGTDAFQYVWFSDMHGVTGYPNQNGAGTSSQTNIGKVSRYLCDRFDIPFAATSGDIMSQASHSNVQNVYNEYKNIRTVLSPIPADRLLAVRGNHDGSWGEAVNGVYYLKHIGAGKLYNEIYRRQAQDGQRVFGGDGTYFYADSVPHKVRFIMLNSNTDGDGSNDASGNAVYNSQKVSVYGTEQLAWLGDVALHMPAGWTAVIMAHQPLNTSEDGSLVAGILNAYNAKQSYSNTIQIANDYWGKNISDSIYKTVSVDCDFTNAKGEVAAFFHGHIHKDTVDTQTYAFPCISITTAGGDVRDSSPAERTPGTATETAIDVVTLDKAARKIYMTRVGVGMDRSCSY